MSLFFQLLTVSWFIFKFDFECRVKLKIRLFVLYLSPAIWSASVRILEENFLISKLTGNWFSSTPQSISIRPWLHHE